MAVAKPFKIPVSVLVVIHTPALEVLLLERARHPGYWQSVTGSREEGEPLLHTAVRETAEETGIHAQADQFADWQHENVYEIFPVWRHRYAPGVTHNTEHVFSLQVAGPVSVRLNPEEHSRSIWLPHDEAAARCFSWSNRDAILDLPRRLGLR